MRRRTGYSLLELTLALGIVAVISSVGILALRKSTGSAGSRGLAEGLAEELRSSRQLAMARGTPVAHCFASQNGTLSCTRTIYRALGMPKALAQAPRNFGSEFAGSFLFFGKWNVSGAGFAGEPATATAAGNFNLTGWLSALGGDPALVFFPSGVVRARGLSTLDGRYCILAVQGVTPTSGTASSVLSPYTVAVSPLGDVEVRPGALYGASGLARDGQAPTPTLAGMAWSPPTNHPPVITRVALLPRTNTSIHGPTEYTTSDSIVDIFPEMSDDNDRNFAPISLAVYATDPDGDPLTFRWRSEPANGASGPGAFTYPEAGRMVWSTNEQLGLCSWQPPRDGEYGSHTWSLTVKVEDGHGGVADSSLIPALNRTVVLARRGKIAFDKWDETGADGQEAVFVMNVDGMAPTRITNLHDVNENQPDLSPSGDWVAFCSSQDGDWQGSDIWIATTDGTTRYNLTNTPGKRESYPKWSPDGSMIAFYADDTDTATDLCEVRVVEPHRPSGPPGSSNPGKKVSALCKSSWATCPPTWDPTSRYLAFLDDDATTAGYASSLIIADTTRGEDEPGWPNPGYAWYKRIDGTWFDVYTAAWSPRGDHIALSGLNMNDRDTSVAPDLPIPGTRVDIDERIYVVTVDPDNPINGSLRKNAFPRYLGADGAVGGSGADADDPSDPPDQYPRPIEGWSADDMRKVCWSENGYPPFSWSPGGMYLCCSADRNDDWVYEVHKFHRQGVNPPAYGERVRLTQSTINTVQPAYTSGGGFLVLQAYRDSAGSDYRNRLYRVRPDMPDTAYPVTTGLQLLNEITVDVSTHSVSR